MKFQLLADQMTIFQKVFCHIPIKPTTVDAYTLLRFSATNSQILMEYHTAEFHFSYYLDGVCVDPGECFISIHSVSSLLKFSKNRTALIFEDDPYQLTISDLSGSSIHLQKYILDGDYWTYTLDHPLMILDSMSIQLLAQNKSSSFSKESVIYNSWISAKKICLADQYHVIQRTHQSLLFSDKDFSFGLPAYVFRLIYAISIRESFLKASLVKDFQNNLFLKFETKNCAIIFPADKPEQESLDIEIKPETTWVFARNDLQGVLEHINPDKYHPAVHLQVNQNQLTIHYQIGTAIQKESIPCKSSLKDNAWYCNLTHLKELISSQNSELIQVSVKDNYMIVSDPEQTTLGKMGLIKVSSQANKTAA